MAVVKKLDSSGIHNPRRIRVLNNNTLIIAGFDPHKIFKISWLISNINYIIVLYLLCSNSFILSRPWNGLSYIGKISFFVEIWGGGKG